ncbi:MAG: response regulator, partial [Candidatus Hydrothermarchaeaceae archaeon]
EAVPSLKIMVVDDDPDVIIVLKKILKKFGCEVVGITDSRNCVSRVKEEMPDLIFLDVMMPGVDGWEICKKLKDDPATAHIFISMVTVRCERVDKEKSIRYAKANQHLCKPMNIQEIGRIVKKAGSSEGQSIS